MEQLELPIKKNILEEQIYEQNSFIEEKLVVKHNKLIEFKGKLTTNEIKLLSLIISDVRTYKQHEQFKAYDIDISMLRDLSNHKGFYGYMKDLALRLENKRIIVEKINENNVRETSLLRLINKPKITEDTYNLEVYIDKDLIPYIMDLKKNLTSYQIENILKLKSGHSVRIYELLKQYETIKKREIQVTTLKEYLGIGEGEYKRFTDFERWVLKVAEKEINKHTDLNVSYTKHKKGRSIDSIIFRMESKACNEECLSLEPLYDITNLKVKMGLDDANMNAKQIIEIYEIAVKKNPEGDIDIYNYIKLNYEYVQKKDSAKNKFAYLKKALNEDYGNATAKLKVIDAYQ